jgi:FkbM family methyltransferase
MKAQFAEGIRWLRPAPLASAIAHISGLNRRTFVHTEYGTFFVNPVSNLGFLLRRGEYEPSTREVLSQYLKPGGVFVDLGANEGYFTVLASRLVGSRGMVIAVEPQSRLQAVIQTNIAANNCHNVRLVRAAISSKTQRVYLELASDMNNGATSLFRRTKYPLPKEEVQSYTLAELFHSIEMDQCDLMKVDIEGAEYDLLMGAQEVLKRGVIRHMVIEAHDSILARRGLSWERTHQVVSECGYRLANQRNPWVYSFGG